MCVLCKDLTKLSEQHIEEVAKGMRPEQIKVQISDIKKAVSYYESYTIGDFCDGWEEQAVADSLQRLRTAQKILSRHV